MISWIQEVSNSIVKVIIVINLRTQIRQLSTGH